MDCKNCYWFEQCEKFNIISSECEDFDLLDDSNIEDFWTEMSYANNNTGE